MTTQLTELQKQAVHYADIRKRLFYSKPKTAPVKSKPVVEEIPAKKPAWKVSEVSFDFHVVESRRILDMISSGEIELVRIKQRTITQIVLDTLENYPGITIKQIKGNARARKISDARQQCIYAVRSERQDLDYPEIGRWFGGRNHSSIYYAYYKIAGQKGNEELGSKYNQKRDRLNEYHAKRREKLLIERKSGNLAA